MSVRVQLTLYFVAAVSMAVAFSINDSIFNNFLSDTFDLGADARGRLEFPREMPGFLVVLTTGILYRLAVTHLGVVGGLVFAAGMAGLAFWGSEYGLMVIMMMVASTGLHLLQPVEASVVLGLSGPANRGARLGLAGAFSTLGAVLGSGFVWLTFDRAAPQYRTGFLCAAGAGLVAAGVYSLMHSPHLHQPRARLVIRKRYSLYYILEFLFGARKQIFITFGPWVLIRVYGQPASEIAELFMIAALIGIGFKPMAGLAIDRLGERRILIADGLMLIVICIGYGYALRLFDNPQTARRVACGCFVADSVLFALGTSRAVYLSRLTHSPQELTSTLSMGVSINHIVSMTIPTLGGAIWERLGYERVFAAAAILAIGNALVATRVPKKGAVAVSGGGADR